MLSLEINLVEELNSLLETAVGNTLSELEDPSEEQPVCGTAIKG